MLGRAAVARNIRIHRNLADAQASPEWPRWKAAIEKEIGGLIRLGVYNEVNRNNATTKVVPTQMIFDIKLDGSFKCRFVVRGDLTTKGEHYLETRSSMVSMEAVRTVLALAAGNDWALTTTDFSQAYCHATEDNKSLFCELQALPFLSTRCNVTKAPPWPIKSLCAASNSTLGSVAGDCKRTG